MADRPNRMAVSWVKTAYGGLFFGLTANPHSLQSHHEKVVFISKDR